MRPRKCPKCKDKTLLHRHDTAHGISGTHMEGSERWECPDPECGFLITNEEDGVQYGLTFILDTKY